MVTSKRVILTSLSIWLAALGFSFTYFQLGFIFYSFIFTNTAALITFGVLIFVHVGILKRLRQRSRYWRKRRAMENTKSNLRENQKKSYQCKHGQQDSQSIDDCASCVFFFVHTSLCYNLLVKFLHRL